MAKRMIKDNVVPDDGAQGALPANEEHSEKAISSSPKSESTKSDAAKPRFTGNDPGPVGGNGGTGH